MSEDYYKLIFSQNLKKYMDLNGKEQIDLINDLGYNKSAVSTWCNGTRLPRMDKVDTLAKYFGISRSDLIEEHQDTPDTYYLNDETKEIAIEIHRNPDMRGLFDIARNTTPERLKVYYNFLKQLHDQDQHND